MLDTSLMLEVQRSGFDKSDTIIHLLLAGRSCMGAKVGATDDLDLYGVFVDGPAQTLGLQPRGHFVWSTATDDRRNGPEDVDLTLYSLRRWAQLAAKGNATALHFLFAQSTATSDELWGTIQERSDLFLSKRSAEQLFGFAGNQLRRITGESGRGAKGRRPEYESAFGYDTKAAMHCLRLYLECIELMKVGRITLPRPERAFLVEARSGDWTLERFMSEAGRLRAEAEDAATQSKLPEGVDPIAIGELVAKVYLAAWNAHGH